MEPLIKLAPQLRFLWDELQGPESGAWDKFNKPYVTAADAATAWDQTYERSGGAGDDRARAYAKDVHSAFNGGDPSGLPPNAKYAYGFLSQKGMSPEQAAGITGRLMVESHSRIDPAARNTLGGGDGTYGIAQWRGDRLENLASANNVSMDDIRNAPISSPEGRYFASSSPQQPQVSRGSNMNPTAQQPKMGLLERMGMAGDDPGRLDRFQNTMEGIQLALNPLLHRPDPNLAQNIAGQRKQRGDKQTANKTAEWLKANGRPDLGELVGTGVMPAGEALGVFYQEPKDNTPTGYLELQMRAKAAGLKPGSPGWQEFMLNGGGKPANFRALQEQALAAGLEPGSPGWQEFMATRGAGLQEYAGQTGKNQANIDTGGRAARVVAEGSAIGTIEGKAGAQARIDLPKLESQAQDAISLIDDITNDPALASITGTVQGNLPAGVPYVTGGQAGADLNVKILQLKGKVFLEAYESLRGAQAITDIEGQKAEQAKARLERAQSEEAYVAAMNDLKSVIESGLALARQKAGGTSQSSGAGTASGVPDFSTMTDAQLDAYIKDQQQ